jgi:hypothetical protein
MKTPIILAAFVALFFAACTPSAPQKPIEISPTPANSTSQELIAPAIVFEFEKTEINKGDGLSISLRTANAKGGGSGVSEKINMLLNDNAFTTLSGFVEVPATEKTIPAALKAIVASHKAFKKESEDDEMDWEFEITDSIYLNTPDFISLVRGEYQFTGGAHPLYYYTYYNIDPKTGRQLFLADLFTDTTALLPLVEAKFKTRWAEVLAETKGDYNKAGFDFPNNKFILPRNFCIREKDVAFFYNSYEIAAYVMGPTEIYVPKTEIIHLLKIK